MTEVWKIVPDHGGYYEASSHGRIRSLRRTVQKRTRWGGMVMQNYSARVLSPAVGEHGHKSVHLGYNGRRVTALVHRMVAAAFHGPPPAGTECCHNNGNASDNRPENLRWDTHANNNADRKAHGNYASGLAHHQAKFPAELVARIVSGQMRFKEAEAMGVSRTHYFRLRKRTSEWFHASYGIDLLALADVLWAQSEAANDA